MRIFTVYRSLRSCRRSCGRPLLRTASRPVQTALRTLSSSLANCRSGLVAIMTASSEGVETASCSRPMETSRPWTDAEHAPADRRFCLPALDTYPGAHHSTRRGPLFHALPIEPQSCCQRSLGWCSRALQDHPRRLHHHLDAEGDRGGLSWKTSPGATLRTVRGGIARPWHAASQSRACCLTAASMLSHPAVGLAVGALHMDRCSCAASMTILFVRQAALPGGKLRQNQPLHECTS